MQQRAEHIAEWVRLTEEKKGAQLAPPGGHQPYDKGIKSAVRDLGIDRTEAQRAIKIASLSDEAKDAARAEGLDDNQSALLKAAAAPREQQARVVHEIAESRRLKVDSDVKDRAAKEVAEITWTSRIGD